MADYLDVFTERAKDGYIAVNHKTDSIGVATLQERGFVVKELKGKSGEYTVTWSDSDKVQPRTLREHAYNYWKERLYPKAEAQARVGCYVLDLSGRSLVTQGVPYFEADGFQVDIDEEKTKILSLRWERPTKGKALELRGIAQSSGKMIKNFIKREGLLDIPRYVGDLTKIFKLPHDIPSSDVESVLKDKFPHVKVMRIARDDDYYVVKYLG